MSAHRRPCLLVVVAGASALTAVFAADAAAAKHPQLRAAGLSLVPAGRAFRLQEAVREHSCFIRKGVVAPCVQFTVRSRGVAYAPRKRLFIANARRRGWALTRRQQFSNHSAFLFFRRGKLRAKIGLGPDDRTNVEQGNFVEVFIPSEAKPMLPSLTIRSRATAADKHRFLVAANAACSRVAARLKRERPPKDPQVGVRRIRDEWRALVQRIATLRRPRGDEHAVERVLAEFRRYGSALDALLQAKGEDVLGAAAALSVFGKRARHVARAYGLTACVPLIG
jgi:hypothetical protein